MISIKMIFANRLIANRGVWTIYIGFIVKNWVLIAYISSMLDIYMWTIGFTLMLNSYIE